MTSGNDLTPGFGASVSDPLQDRDTGSPQLLGGRYEVGDLIGRGGMAEVHLGYDIRLGRTVAIKILRWDLARDSSFLARFRREAQSAAGLNHPVIVAVYDSGEERLADSGGGSVSVPYIVMERVDGQTLRDLLNEQSAFSPDEAARVTGEILAALDYSHDKSIIHRDIKPANVMVTHHGAVKVMDFGIARALADTAATMTQSQAVFGTARYLSPEQGQGKHADARSDIYSTGCLLYELLTGRTPFLGDPVSLVYQHVGEVPQPPSVYQPNIDPALDAVTLHALVKDPARRYQTAGAFRQDLQNIRSGRPISPAALGRPVSGDPTTTMASSAAGFGTDGPTRQQLPARTAAPARDPSESRAAAALLEGRESGPKTAPIPLVQERRRTGMWVLLSMFVLAALAVLAFGGYRYFGPVVTSSSAQTVDIPTVTGLSQAAAAASLVDHNLRYAVINKASSTQQGVVIAQDPPAKQRARVDSTVTITVSSGPQMTAVPDVVGQRLDSAEQQLRSLNLKVGKVSKVDDPDIEAGSVVRTDPAYGVSVTPGRSVAIQVASGKVVVPTVLNQTLNDAFTTLFLAHLETYNPTYVASTRQAGTVIRQSDAGQRVDVGTKIHLTVSAGPRPTSRPPTSSSPTSSPTSSTTSPTPTSSSPTSSSPTSTGPPSSTSSPTSSSPTSSSSSSTSSSSTSSSSTSSSPTSSSSATTVTPGAAGTASPPREASAATLDQARALALLAADISWLASGDIP